MMPSFFQSPVSHRHPIIIEVNGSEYEGWISSSVTRSLEDISGSFSVPVSFLPDNEIPPIKRQDAVTLKIGGEIVMTGWVIGADPFYSRTDIGMQIEGRDKAGDLAVASAMHKGGQWRNATIAQIASDLCQPFDIKVLVETDIGAPLKRFEIEQGETVSDCIARAASYRGVMVTSNTKGDLVLTNAGTRKAPASIVAGENVISMQPSGNDDQVYSDYYVQGQGEMNDSDPKTAHSMKGHGKDPKMKRHLPYLEIADNSSELADLQQQAEHMARVRYAQSRRYTYTLEGWAAVTRDDDAKVWELNTLVSVYDPVLGLAGEEWLICDINLTVSRDNADVAELTICPPEAFEQLPVTEPEAPVMQRSRGDKSGDGKGKGKNEDLIDWRPGAQRAKGGSSGGNGNGANWT